MKEIEKVPKTPDKTTVSKKHKRAPEKEPEKEEEERPRYYSPPCMMGELDEIVDDQAGTDGC